MFYTLWLTWNTVRYSLNSGPHVGPVHMALKLFFSFWLIPLVVTTIFISHFFATISTLDGLPDKLLPDHLCLEPKTTMHWFMHPRSTHIMNLMDINSCF